MIPLCRPTITGNEEKYFLKFITNTTGHSKSDVLGNDIFYTKCSDWFENIFTNSKVYLVKSCTHALEMAGQISGIQPGDEIILPSYTYVSTASAFSLLGAKPVFVDIRPDTMNLDETLIENAITPRTKIIIPVQNAGVPCEMDAIKEIAKKHNLIIIEDAAYGILSKYKNKYLGTIGDIGCISFDSSKSINCSQGGIVIVNNPELIPKADIIYEIGTNRRAFFNGETEHYEWLGNGSKYKLAELNCAFLFAQLEKAEEVLLDLNKKQAFYISEIKRHRLEGIVELPYSSPVYCDNFAQIFYIKVKDKHERKKLIHHFKKNGIESAFFYVPLHLSKFGKKTGFFSGKDRFTQKESERILRLPFYYKINTSDIKKIVLNIKTFYDNK